MMYYDHNDYVIMFLNYLRNNLINLNSLRIMFMKNYFDLNEGIVEEI
jgi:hypothetical protein